MNAAADGQIGLAVIVGAHGGIGAALLSALGTSPWQDQFSAVIGLGRRTTPALDLLDEASIMACAAHVAGLGRLGLLIDATGLLHDAQVQPEKSLRQIDPQSMARSFAINAIGPALLMKHFLPLLPRTGRPVFASLSAKVGSIGDNRLGGWYSYRASKAALNQLVHTAAIELQRRAPQAICVALHPGTVDTRLSTPFARTGLQVQSPAQAADALLRVIAGLTPADTGGFFSYQGEALPW